MLDDKMLNNILSARTILFNIAHSDNQKAIKTAIDNLQNSCLKFVEIRMNSAVMKAMQGHNIDEF
jgi:molecular chaperone HscA